MVKALDSPYDAGRRGGAWRKVKPVHTLDLVVLAAEWGNGRRQGWLSNLHLGARGPDGDDSSWSARRSRASPTRCWSGRPSASGARDRPRRHHRARAARARRRDRARRRAGVAPLPGRRRAALRPGARATATTRPPPTPTRSRPSAPCCGEERLLGQLLHVLVEVEVVAPGRDLPVPAPRTCPSPGARSSCSAARRRRRVR